MNVLFLILGIILLILPFLLTIENIIAIFMEKAKIFGKKRKIVLIIDMLIMSLGPILTGVLYFIVNTHKDFEFQFTVYKSEPEPPVIPLHSILATWTIPSILTIAMFAIISYIIIRLCNKKLSPLIIVTGVAGMYLGSILSLTWLIHIVPTLIANHKILEFYFVIFPINYMICSARLIIDLVSSYEKKDFIYKSKILAICNGLLENSKKWPIYALILMLPILAIILIILVLFGQRPDAIIQAFIQTSDWTLSLKESPPPIFVEPKGHYLCTISLKGHPKIVKPIRYGIRYNNKIIVNRQLCIANAFEDLIKEHVPAFHRQIRNFYDKYGYPLSKHINTAISADIVYIFMKPLEYLFLFALYLFDKNPENRIARQYLPKII